MNISKKIYTIIVALILFLQLPIMTQSQYFDCVGTPFHCVNTTHFMICVDFGNGKLSTIDDVMIPCPPGLECHVNNNLECEIPDRSASISSLKSETTTEATKLTHLDVMSTKNDINNLVEENLKKEKETNALSTDNSLLKKTTTYATKDKIINKDAMTESLSKIEGILQTNDYYNMITPEYITMNTVSDVTLVRTTEVPSVSTHAKINERSVTENNTFSVTTDNINNLKLEHNNSKENLNNTNSEFNKNETSDIHVQYLTTEYFITTATEFTESNLLNTHDNNIFQTTPVGELYDRDTTIQSTTTSSLEININSPNSDGNHYKDKFNDISTIISYNNGQQNNEDTITNTPFTISLNIESSNVDELMYNKTLNEENDDKTDTFYSTTVPNKNFQNSDYRTLETEVPISTNLLNSNMDLIKNNTMYTTESSHFEQINSKVVVDDTQTTVGMTYTQNNKHTTTEADEAINTNFIDLNNDVSDQNMLHGQQNNEDTVNTNTLFTTSLNMETSNIDELNYDTTLNEKIGDKTDTVYSSTMANENIQKSDYTTIKTEVPINTIILNSNMDLINQNTMYTTESSYFEQNNNNVVFDDTQTTVATTYTQNSDYTTIGESATINTNSIDLNIDVKDQNMLHGQQNNEDTVNINTLFTTSLNMETSNIDELIYNKTLNKEIGNKNGNIYSTTVAYDNIQNSAYTTLKPEDLMSTIHSNMDLINYSTLYTTESLNFEQNNNEVVDNIKAPITNTQNRDYTTIETGKTITTSNIDSNKDVMHQNMLHGTTENVIIEDNDNNSSVDIVQTTFKSVNVQNSDFTTRRVEKSFTENSNNIVINQNTVHYKTEIPNTNTPIENIYIQNENTLYDKTESPIIDNMETTKININIENIDYTVLETGDRITLKPVNSNYGNTHQITLYDETESPVIKPITVPNTYTQIDYKTDKTLITNSINSNDDVLHHSTVKDDYVHDNSIVDVTQTNAVNIYNQNNYYTIPGIEESVTVKPNNDLTNQNILYDKTERSNTKEIDNKNVVDHAQIPTANTFIQYSDSTTFTTDIFLNENIIHSNMNEMPVIEDNGNKMYVDNTQTTVANTKIQYGDNTTRGTDESVTIPDQNDDLTTRNIGEQFIENLVNSNTNFMYRSTRTESSKTENNGNMIFGDTMQTTVGNKEINTIEHYIQNSDYRTTETNKPSTANLIGTNNYLTNQNTLYDKTEGPKIDENNIFFVDNTQSTAMVKNAQDGDLKKDTSETEIVSITNLQNSNNELNGDSTLHNDKTERSNIENNDNKYFGIRSTAAIQNGNDITHGTEKKFSVNPTKTFYELVDSISNENFGINDHKIETSPTMANTQDIYFTVKTKSPAVPHYIYKTSYSGETKHVTLPLLPLDSTTENLNTVINYHNVDQILDNHPYTNAEITIENKTEQLETSNNIETTVNHVLEKSPDKFSTLTTISTSNVLLSTQSLKNSVITSSKVKETTFPNKYSVDSVKNASTTSAVEISKPNTLKEDSVTTESSYILNKTFKTSTKVTPTNISTNKNINLLNTVTVNNFSKQAVDNVIRNESRNNNEESIVEIGRPNIIIKKSTIYNKEVFSSNNDTIIESMSTTAKPHSKNTNTVNTTNTTTNTGKSPQTTLRTTILSIPIDNVNKTYVNESKYKNSSTTQVSTNYKPELNVFNTTYDNYHMNVSIHKDNVKQILINTTIIIDENAKVDQHLSMSNTVKTPEHNNVEKYIKSPTISEKTLFNNINVTEINKEISEFNESKSEIYNLTNIEKKIFKNQGEKVNVTEKNSFNNTSISQSLSASANWSTNIDHRETLKDQNNVKDININEFSCSNRNRGKYSDNDDCRKFYICIRRQYNPMVNYCPVNTVFSDLKKQCTKNLSHCVRLNEFQCIQEGRFVDYLENNIYYICVKKNPDHFYRYKLQCQRDYYLDNVSIKCVHSSLTSNNEDKSKSNKSAKSESKQSSRSAQSSVKTISAEESSKETKEFQCRNEGTYPDNNDCRKYYVCRYKSNRQNVLRRKRKRCQRGEVFHKELKECVDSQSYECE